MPIYFFLFLFVSAACSVTSRTKEGEALSGGVVVYLSLFLAETKYGSAAVQGYSSWH